MSKKGMELFDCNFLSNIAGGGTGGISSLTGLGSDEPFTEVRGPTPSKNGTSLTSALFAASFLLLFLGSVTKAVECLFRGTV